ncbi:hypothetical protein M9H77_03398 [Catharanthus roseus]|uniref:Uncharacterized protein n=1 Tax=Catharanthus roseus TaxID=4058 RepID=A0ACC0CBB1_CATRO|nr:hypothetical protein M9H77_03398 [Catharanthus roseus]
MRTYARINSIEASQRNQEASIRNLEKQIGQLVKLVLERTLGTLSNNAEENKSPFRKLSKELKKVEKLIFLHSIKKSLKKLGQKRQKKREKAKTNSDFKDQGVAFGCTRKNGTRSENKMNAREDPTSHTPGPGQTFPRHKMKFRNGTGDEFNGNMFFKSNPYKTYITTTVKGIRLHLDRAILAQNLGIPNEGHSIFYEHASTSILADPTWVYFKALASFHVHAQAVTSIGGMTMKGRGARQFNKGVISRPRQRKKKQRIWLRTTKRTIYEPCG